MSDLSADIIRIHREQWEQEHMPDALRNEPESVRQEYLSSAFKRELRESTLEAIGRELSG